MYRLVNTHNEQHSSLAFRLEDIGEVNKIKIFITMRTIISFVFLTTLLILSGCNPTPSNGTNQPPSLPSPNTKKAEVGSLEEKAQEPESNLPQELPTPTIQSESGISIPAVQGSYCWGGMCADYAGDVELLEGKAPVSVLVGENISINLNTVVPPNEFALVEYVNGEARPISLREGTFQFAQEKGTHYYGALVGWSSPKNSQVSLGDTSFAFVIRGVEKK
ncbi:hypothetical protein DET54_10985 [Paenibacillus pabuli]|uniref:Lipoprotein n=1 Tax=Paenibacillus pabuli TaxID=1472 RepID=A0ABX9BHP4_9BACL|nr:hypothetical protein DET54_10985 [Paenibacillus pabuli]